MAYLKCRSVLRQFGQTLNARSLTSCWGEVRLRRRKRLAEVRERLPLPAVEPTFSLHREDVAAPAVLNGLLGVPDSLWLRLHPIDRKQLSDQTGGQVCAARLVGALR